MKKTNAIFLCTHNSARSQMAEAFLRKYAGDYFNVFSAGFKPAPIYPYAIKVMNEIGISIENQEPKALKKYLGKKHFGVVITVCDKAEKLCPTLPGVSTRLFWPFDDPAAFQGSDEEKINKFREIRDQIDKKIKEWLKKRNIPITK
ncbi:MAG: arsenate reductase ArsC [Candidatus Lokiarchaeota archaeon]|nr:arsenate reductase ArsC [Candidatus Lokiarchaeota archaeon]